MNTNIPYARQATARDLLFFQTPALWPLHPFLPVVRLRHGHDEPELGLLYDARGMSGTCGYSATVFVINLFQVPPSEAKLLQMPKIVYDTADELAADGWTVD